MNKRGRRQGGCEEKECIVVVKSTTTYVNESPRRSFMKCVKHIVEKEGLSGSRGNKVIKEKYKRDIFSSTNPILSSQPKSIKQLNPIILLVFVVGVENRHQAHSRYPRILP
jgi:hypothetical protein